MKKIDLLHDMEYVEDKRCHFANMIRNRQIFTYEELVQTLYGLTGVLYHILDDMRIQKGAELSNEADEEFGTIPFTREEFEAQICSECGTQRCEGIDSDWFNGCIYKDLLKQDSEQEK